MRVFIVDDSSVVRERLVALLSDLQGIEISGQAENAAEAIQSIRGLSPDAVILDLQIRGGNGLDVLRDIKRRGASAVVLVFTNDPFPGSEQRCRDAGADYFFDKTTDVEKLIDSVKSLEQACRSDNR
jgi:DNA-binding NarL/FixJ family response regulator